jgi:Flp pilus assembly protein TadD
MLGSLTAGCAGQRTPGLSTGSQLQLAEAADAQGAADVALSMYRAAAARADGDVSAQLRYADALARAGRVKQAQQVLTQQLQRHPEQHDLARASAIVDIISGDAPGAVSKLDRLLAAAPHDERVLADKGVALDLLGRHADAQALYHQALAVAPDDVSVKNNLALSLMLQGRRQEAQAVLEEIGEADDAPARVRTNLGVLYAANGDTNRAQQITNGQVNQDDLMMLAKGLRTTSPAADR